MFEYLAEFPVILVTGPQRSGTRICAKMIAHDTGHRHVDEREIHTDSLYELFLQLHFAEEKGEKIVVQCPALCHDVIHCWRYEPCIVLMRRDLTDIRASIGRIQWHFDKLEGIKFWDWMDQQQDVPESAYLKYRYWEKVLLPLIRKQNIAYQEVEYESLAEHPLWVAKEDRKKFDAWQTEVVK